MYKGLAAVALAMMQTAAQAESPAILLIYRETLKPGAEAAYQEIEEEIARTCVKNQCPHAYLGIEALTGPKEVWFFNGYRSQADVEQVKADWTKRDALIEALGKLSKQKAALTFDRADVFANHRPDLTRGPGWRLGEGRFLVITISKDGGAIDGTVFETADGWRVIVTPAQSREAAEARLATAGPEARLFAVRPRWSAPAPEWIAADPEFWR
jgi:hypothetical protein